MNEFVKMVKQAAVEAVAAGDPMGVCFGTVTCAQPLQITVDQKMILTGGQLILTSQVREFTVEMTVDHETQAVSHGHTVADTYTGGGSALPVEHSHPYKGRKAFRVHRGLETGEKVILLRCDGGQRFVVLDRWEGGT